MTEDKDTKPGQRAAKEVFEFLLTAYTLLFGVTLAVACIIAAIPGNPLCAPPIIKTRWSYILPARQIACFLGEPIMTEDNNK